MNFGVGRSETFLVRSDLRSPVHSTDRFTKLIWNRKQKTTHLVEETKKMTSAFPSTCILANQAME